MQAVAVFVDIMIAYALAGVLFGTVFVVAGVQRIDHGAVGAGVGFRLIILPGAALFWPLLLARWLRSHQ